MNGLEGHWLLLLPVAFFCLAVWWLLPRPPTRSRAVGRLLMVIALLAGGVQYLHSGGDVPHDLLFGLFAAAAVIAAVLMITNSNPLYAALWFAVVTLSVCGLFLLRSAPFLAAATVIVYAGAVIVTFLFVIMLAQQAGSSSGYDQRSTQPLLATLLAGVVLGGLLCALQSWSPMLAMDVTAAEQSGGSSDASGRFVLAAPRTATASLDPGERLERVRVGSVRGLGRTLFGDYLYAIELAGTLLLVASVGAIAIALRPPRGNP